MCLNPVLLPNGVITACRKCWQCHERKIDDWVGRNYAESKFCKQSHSVTLTYGRDENGNEDHLRAAVLTYSDVQKYLKKLRFDGYAVRYFAVGEYGSLKSRAHWHIILHWQDKIPEDIILYERFNQKHWDHGFSEYRPFTEKNVRYVCKYIQKDVGTYQSHLSMSKKPPLGDNYFKDLANLYALAYLAPQNAEYSFPEIEYKGKPKVYFMGTKTLDNFLRYYVKRWIELYGQKWIPESQLVDEWLDKQLEAEIYKPIAGMTYEEMERQVKWRKQNVPQAKPKYVKPEYVNPYDADANYKYPTQSEFIQQQQRRYYGDANSDEE